MHLPTLFYSLILMPYSSSQIWCRRDMHGNNLRRKDWANSCLVKRDILSFKGHVRQCQCLTMTAQLDRLSGWKSFICLKVCICTDNVIFCPNNPASGVMTFTCTTKVKYLSACLLLNKWFDEWLKDEPGKTGILGYWWAIILVNTKIYEGGCTVILLPIPNLNECIIWELTTGVRQNYQPAATN